MHALITSLLKEIEIFAILGTGFILQIYTHMHAHHLLALNIEK